MIEHSFLVEGCLTLPSNGGNVMNWDLISGKWMQFKGKVKEKWGKLTDDDLDVIAGKKDQLLGKLQQRYGYEKDQAEKEIDEFARLLDKP
jgi:uncharacterized protein YjbJ (UPF0337 family)